MIRRATLNDTDWIIKMLHGRSTVVDTTSLSIDVYDALAKGIGYVIGNNEGIWIYTIEPDYICIPYFCVVEGSRHKLSKLTLRHAIRVLEKYKRPIYIKCGDIGFLKEYVTKISKNTYQIVGFRKLMKY